MDRNEKAVRFPISLFCSLMLLSLIPFLYTLVRTRMIASLPLTDGLGIAGHIEWFDLINETVQAFLTAPLFALFHRCERGTREWKERIFQAFLIGNGIYALFSILILLHCREIVSAMAFGQISEVTRYLRLETVGFLIGNMVCFIHVLFVLLEKPCYIYAMTALKTIAAIMGDLFLIPKYGVDGVAYSNIAVSAACVLLCLAVVCKERLIVVSFRVKWPFVRDYLFIGLFSGLQILLDNLIYAAVVCNMVNAVAEQGNYWIANNIIWGLMLIPILALAEVIKKDCQGELTSARMKRYNAVIIITFLCWLCFIPLLGPFLKYGMGIEELEPIKQILTRLIPFYFAYSYSVLFDQILIGRGKTYYCFAISAIVNLIYYPILYVLVLKGVFTPSITFICRMFGFGMVTHLGCSILCYGIFKRRSHLKKDT